MPQAAPDSMVDNSTFLNALSASAANGTSLWVTSFVGSPDLTDAANWRGKPYSAALMRAQVDGWTDENTYFAVAALKPTADGEVKRRKACFARLLALVADDVQLEDVQGQVSYVLTTSPGKQQVGILLDGSDDDAANIHLVDKLVTTMADRGLLRADMSGNNCVRYVRLPVGQNQKPRDTGAFRVHLEQWKPEVRMSLQDAAAAFGVDLDELRAVAASNAQPSNGVGRQDELLRTLTTNVIKGDGLHDAVNQIAASLVASGANSGSVVNLLRGLMDASEAPRDERFRARFADIPRAVTSAEEKFRKPVLTTAATQSDLILTINELHARAGAVSWAVKGVISEQALGFVYGATGTFKSFVVLDYALHRAYGLRWMGRRTKQSIPVYLAAEGGTGLMRRIEAWHKARGMDWRKCPMRVVIVPLTLRTESATLRAAIDAAGLHPGDVVIDTMSQTFTGNENSNDEVADFLRVLGSELRDGLGCTVTVVHHTGHSATERPRGASAIIANVDFAFGVFRDEKEMLCTLEFAKVKDGERPDPATFQLSVSELGRDEDGDAITSLSARHINNADELVAAMATETNAGRAGRHQQLLSLVQNGMPEKELRKAFYESLNITDIDSKKKAFYRSRDWAVSNGIIEIAGEDRRIIVLRSVE